MFELLFTMLERLGIIVTVAFVITRFRFFKQMIQEEKISYKQQLFAIIFFGIFGIIGTYTGVSFNSQTAEYNRWVFDLGDTEAIANSRVIGIIIAGLLGGFRIGIGAGLIAGVQRYTLGGYTAFSCGAASVVAGILSGFFYKKRRKPIKLSTAFIVGALAEAVQMMMILVLAKPFDQALVLVKQIALPMIFANGLGSALFLLIIQNVLKEEEKAGALQAQKALRLAENTVRYLRKGLNFDTARAVCDIIFREVDASAVSITNHERILAYAGLGDDHHHPNSLIKTDIARKVIQEGQMVIAGHDDIHCTAAGCPLGAAVVAPLKSRGETVGTLKFYFQSERDISNVNLELVRGLSSLLSQQLEISETEKAYQLAKEAEIKALQAQISPHFLFNSLNVIISLIRSQPDHARKLLISLSRFFRQNLSGTTKQWATLEDELKHVRAYLSIEEARFVDKLTIVYDIDDAVLGRQIPPLTLQPIVENALKHGLKDKERDCKVIIEMKECDGSTRIAIKDNGKGIANEMLQEIGIRHMDSTQGTGLGLYNVNRRLEMMLGDEAALKIDSKPDGGTTISFLLPAEKEGNGK
ncbi:two-component system sensor histidine kinase LytS [Scopulibacillus darangshiensis]|uniref:histidine kinase n=1 Tax=Scopulibacillus darangshiensis TaxID=442528 RepID=A0A4R2NSR3_9BACL|nr:sensor histidine kinase [Scopulibacillus darangshiensis]TCP24940.1 two-component system sensor histidine kinase LytS [Scopulibacillus darangshiensis]